MQCLIASSCRTLSNAKDLPISTRCQTGNLIKIGRNIRSCISIVTTTENNDLNGDKFLQCAEDNNLYIQDKHTVPSRRWRKEYNLVRCSISSNSLMRILPNSRTVRPSFPHSQCRNVKIEMDSQISNVDSAPRPRFNKTNLPNTQKNVTPAVQKFKEQDLPALRKIESLYRH